MAFNSPQIGDFNAAYAWILFTYDVCSGEVRNRSDRSYNAKKGALVGCYNIQGYLTVKIKGKDYQLHRIIWLMMTGEWPDKTVDHMNRNGSDNSWNNLRLATYSQQGRNVLQHRNVSGTNGVAWVVEKQKWIVQRIVDCKWQCLGFYVDKEEAVRVKEELDFEDLRRGWTWHGLWVWDW